MAVSPDGRMVFVTGYTSSTWNAKSDYATVAYSAATGRQLWASRYNGPMNLANSVAVSPGGATVFVTGYSQGRGTGQSDYATVAYSAATGRQLWASRRNGTESSLAVSPDGATIFVTAATSYGYATVAYRG